MIACNECDYPETIVKYTQHDNENKKVTRRRECLKCGNRFTTVEEMKKYINSNDKRVK
jgi:transcriptional regulator NrdR family protein